MKKIFVCLCCVLFVSQQIVGQENNNNSNNRSGSDAEAQNALWTGNFAGGQILIPLNKIAAIAQHKYVLDGQFVVYEVTIDSVGSALTRIYYIEPIAASVAGASALGATVRDRAREIGADLQNRTGTSGIDPETTVSKNYPTTTHAHTVEFRARTLDEINGVSRSLSTALQRNRGRTFSHRQ